MERSTKHYRKLHYAGRKPSRYERRRPALPLLSAYTQSPKSHVKQGAHRVEFDLHEHDDDLRHRLSSRVNRGHANNDNTLVAGDSSFDSSSEVSSDLNSDESLFHWEEGSTLLSELMEDGPMQSGEEDLDALVESLQTPFSEQGKLLKKEIAETLVTTNNHIKSVFGALKKNVDGSFYQGLSAFDRACKDIERCAAEQKAFLWDNYESTQEEIEKTFKELEKEYEARDRLWDKLFEDVDAIVTPAVEYYKGIPARVEDSILKLEKRAKAIENDSRGMSSLEKGIQDLLRHS